MPLILHLPLSNPAGFPQEFAHPAVKDPMLPKEVSSIEKAVLTQWGTALRLSWPFIREFPGGVFGLFHLNTSPLRIQKTRKDLNYPMSMTGSSCSWAVVDLSP